MCVYDHEVLTGYHSKAVLEKLKTPSQPSKNSPGTGVMIKHLWSSGKTSSSLPETFVYMVVTFMKLHVSNR